MKSAVVIENCQDKVAIKQEHINLIEKTVLECLMREKIDIPCEVSVTIVDDERIRQINNEYRKVDKPTDVLSFPIADFYEGYLESDLGDCDLDRGLLLLGDIVLSAERAVEQAEQYGHSLEREIAFLICHSMLHLLGYDHMNECQERLMFDKQENILTCMGIVRK